MGGNFRRNMQLIIIDKIIFKKEISIFNYSLAVLLFLSVFFVFIMINSEKIYIKIREK